MMFRAIYYHYQSNSTNGMDFFADNKQLALAHAAKVASDYNGPVKVGRLQLLKVSSIRDTEAIEPGSWFMVSNNMHIPLV